ncbi:Histone-lysine N-methyltransferase SETDB1 [Echinococcus granulosus]|nr:Histone-lysine N-methyltransferase SETDB1 [Echinococcus granulosus]
MVQQCHYIPCWWSSIHYRGMSTNGSQSVEVDYVSVQTHLVGEHGSHQKTRKSATGRGAGRKPLVSVASVAHDTDGTVATTIPPSLQEAEETGRVQPYLDSFIQSIRVKPYVDHKCVAGCLKSAIVLDDPSSGHRSESPFDYRGLNPLEIPLRAGWLRIYIKATPAAEGRDVIAYVAPCGRHIRSFSELDHFLHQTGSQLTSDLFCFDKEIKINEEFRCEKAFIRIADLSYGKENVPVPCVNSVDNESPCFIDYIPNRKPVGKVNINEDPDFLVCCDCTDNCRDRTKCACQQLTIEASAFSSTKGMVDTSVGYRYRRLSQFTMGGIYECNSRCKCDRRCQNRVVQQGVWVRTQVFKTNRKGWGIRALNAIPKGAFICTYAGAIYDDTKAIEEGYDNGDEYQAELDYIETVEKHKVDYEPYAIEPEESSDFDLPSSNPGIVQPHPPISSRTARKRGGLARRNSSSSISSYSACSNVSKVCEKVGGEADSAVEQAITIPPGNIKISPPSSSVDEGEETMGMSSILDQALAFASSSTTGQIQKVEEREDKGEGSGNLYETKFNPEVVVIKKCDESPKGMKTLRTQAIANSSSGNNGDEHSEFSDTSQVNQIKSEEPNLFAENADGESPYSYSSNLAPTDATAVDTVVPMDVTTSAGDEINEEGPARSRGLSEFTISAPGLTSFQGISNLAEIMTSASFDRLPVVQLTRLSKQEKRLASPSMGQPRRGTRGHLSGRLSDAKMWPPAAGGCLMRSPRSSALAMAYRPTGPRKLLLMASLRKSASNADIACSASQSTGPKRSSSAVDLLRMNQSQPRTGERRPRGKAREHRIHTAIALTTGNGRVGESTETSTVVGALTAFSSTSVLVPWANRRFYPIAQPDWLPARSYFGDEEPFVMDAKKMGNLGRYFNHSCEPNVFVQNVFISSHDPRFPEVAFFAKRNIAAGEELTWDYGYVVDAVPFKVLYCYCGEPSCRIRLL